MQSVDIGVGLFHFFTNRISLESKISIFSYLKTDMQAEFPAKAHQAAIPATRKPICKISI
ncbi:hypothetical protein C9I89_18640 [Photobacterium lipolyticum]|uniref:Uncharacterized protein n=1 Tax=Photobacterium lipolyticum TaxID=266810 RepID=A0A2T3MTQ5_9GAMM|nr:hypothetical protein C9I89_18640 [Photobacterium lipolyticum]